MQYHIVVLVIIFTSSGAYQIEKLDINGLALQTEFDSTLNTYLSVRDDYDRFYKLDTSYNITVSRDFYIILKIIVNKYDEVYIFTIDSPENPLIESVHYLQADSTDVEFLFHFDVSSQWDNPNAYLIDGSDNIYFNGKSGVMFFRRNQHIPLKIGNLEEYYFDDFEIDKSDTVYLATTSPNNRFVTMITEDGKKQPTPYAMIISNLGPSIVEELTKWQELIFVTDKEKTISSVKQVTRSGTSPILVQYDVNYNIISTGNNDRLLVIGKRSSSSYFHYITPDGDLVNIKGNLSSSAFTPEGLYEVDSEGTAYLANNIENRQILMLKHNETQLQVISIPDEDYIVALAVDEEDNLWVLARKLFVLRKGELNVTQITTFEFPTSFYNFLKIKRGTKDLIISTLNGLYLCTED